MAPFVSRAAGAVVVVALGLGLVGCGSDTVEVNAQSTTARGWEALPKAPLSPRTHSVAAWTGKEAVFLGGETDGFCPPNANCFKAATQAKDGAAFDPATGKWRKVADAPVPLAGPMPPVVLDGVVYLIAGGTLLAYDSKADRWVDHGAVPEGAQRSTMSDSGDDRLVVPDPEGKSGRDRLYDPRSREWSVLPLPPGDLADGSRTYVASPAGLVVFGSLKSGREDRPDLIDAAVLDLMAGTWRELPAGEQLGADFHWTGTRLVAAQLGGADGGKVNNWGRRYEYGGTLDPVTGTWGSLPNAPTEYDGRNWGVSAVGGRWTALGGWLYDDVEESWTRLPTPKDAPRAAGAAVWAGDRLIAFGGEPTFTADGVTGPTDAAWSYRV